MFSEAPMGDIKVSVRERIFITPAQLELMMLHMRMDWQKGIEIASAVTFPMLLSNGLLDSIPVQFFSRMLMDKTSETERRV